MKPLDPTAPEKWGELSLTAVLRSGEHVEERCRCFVGAIDYGAVDFDGPLRVQHPYQVVDIERAGGNLVSMRFQTIVRGRSRALIAVIAV